MVSQARLFPTRRRRDKALPFSLQMKAAGIPAWESEFVFHPPRKWAFDWAWPQWQIALEFEGGTFVAGRHTRGLGFELDCEKYNQAAIDGWLVIRMTRAMVERGEAIDTMRRAFAARGLE